MLQAMVANGDDEPTVAAITALREVCTLLPSLPPPPPLYAAVLGEDDVT